MSEVGEIREACGEAARRGGAVLRQRWKMPRTIEYKRGTGPGGSADRWAEAKPEQTTEEAGFARRRAEAKPEQTVDLVTDADRASEAVLIEFLRSRFPGSFILAEESGASGGAPGSLRFYVDPLDGTTNYAHGVPHFAVTVGVEDGAGLLAGATYDPLRDEMYLAARGEGASLNGEPIRVSHTTALSRALLCTGFPYDVHQDPEGPLRLFAAYLRRSRAVRRFGSAALDLAYVACGRFDGFWEMKLKPWDVAAGILLVREAGGAVADFEGGEGMLHGGTICAANRSIQPFLLQILAEARGARGH